LAKKGLFGSIIAAPHNHSPNKPYHSNFSSLLITFSFKPPWHCIRLSFFIVNLNYKSWQRTEIRKTNRKTEVAPLTEVSRQWILSVKEKLQAPADGQHIDKVLHTNGIQKKHGLLEEREVRTLVVVEEAETEMAMKKVIAKSL
jgi:hypothetical protein